MKFNSVIVTTHPHRYPATRYDYATEDEFATAWTEGHVITFDNVADFFDFYAPEEEGDPIEADLYGKLEEEGISRSYEGSIILKNWNESDYSLDQVEIVKEADYNAFEWAEALTGDDMSSSTVTVRQDGESYADFERRAWAAQCGRHNEMSAGRFGIEE